MEVLHASRCSGRRRRASGGTDRDDAVAMALPPSTMTSMTLRSVN